MLFNNKPSGTITATQTGAPWSGQAPYLQYLYGQAQNLPEQQYFPGSTVVPQSPETLQALNMQSQRAMAGSPVQTAGQNQLASTLSGDYLYGGPGFNAAFDAAQRRITPAVQGQFEGAGRFGGGLAQEAETAALSDAFAGLYNQERNRQVTGLGYVPQMAALDYQDIGALANVGQQREAFEGQNLQDQINRHNFAQQAPYNRLDAQSGVIQAGYPGGTTSTESPYFNNTLGQALGGALGLGGLAQELGLIGEGGSLIDTAKDVAGAVPGAAGALPGTAGAAGAAVPGAAGAAGGSPASVAKPLADALAGAGGAMGGAVPAGAGIAAANAGIVPASLSGGGLGTAASAAIPTGGALPAGAGGAAAGGALGTAASLGVAALPAIMALNGFLANQGESKAAAELRSKMRNAAPVTRNGVTGIPIPGQPNLLFTGDINLGDDTGGFATVVNTQTGERGMFHVGSGFRSLAQMEQDRLRARASDIGGNLIGGQIVGGDPFQKSGGAP